MKTLILVKISPLEKYLTPELMRAPTQVEETPMGKDLIQQAARVTTQVNRAATVKQLTQDLLRAPILENRVTLMTTFNKKMNRLKPLLPLLVELLEQD